MREVRSGANTGLFTWSKLTDGRDDTSWEPFAALGNTPVTPVMNGSVSTHRTQFYDIKWWGEGGGAVCEVN